MSDISSSDDSDYFDYGIDRRIRAIMDQLIIAIQAERLGGEEGGDFESRLREILAPLVMDDDIYEAMHVAARNGSVIACRILWRKLSRRGKRQCSKAAKIDVFGPLHAAVTNCHLEVNNACHFEVVRLLIQEFKGNIHQMNEYDLTPLCYAVRHVAMARFLLENGANVYLGGKFGPLWFAVKQSYTDRRCTEVSRILLMEYQANPNLNRRPAKEEHSSLYPQHSRNRNTDLAIAYGSEEILRMLLEHGAYLGNFNDRRYGSTSLNVLLHNPHKPRDMKLVICRILIEHHADNKDDLGMADFVRASFELAIETDTTEGSAAASYHILLDAGMDTRLAMYCAIRTENLSVCQLLVQQYEVNPFSEEEDESSENDSNNDNIESAASPFLAATRLADTSILEYFLGIWNEQFFSTGGKNSNGDYPLHVVCCDPRVSLQAVQLLVNRQADVLAMVDGQQGLLPFHFAANWGTSLDVIFYLLRHCPNVLCHGGNVAAANTTDACNIAAVGTSGSSNGMVETSSDDDKKQKNTGDHGPAKKKAKSRHYG